MVFMIPTAPATAPPKNLDPLSVPSYLISTLAFLFFSFHGFLLLLRPINIPQLPVSFTLSLLDIVFALFTHYIFSLYFLLFAVHMYVCLCVVIKIFHSIFYSCWRSLPLSLSHSSWSASRCPLYRTSAPASPSSGPSSISLALTRFRVQRFILPSQRTTRFLIFSQCLCVRRLSFCYFVVLCSGRQCPVHLGTR